MFKAKRLALLASVGLLPSFSIAQVSLPYIKTHTQANYQGDVAAPDNHDIFFPVSSLPAVAESRSYVPVGGFAGYGRSGVSGMRDIEAAWDDSDAYARGQLPGSDGLYARAGGYSPGHSPPPDNVNALASVELYRNYLVSGTGVVDLDLVTFFEGFLYTSKNSGTPLGLEARVSIEVSMEGALFTGSLFSATAVLNQVTGFSTSGAVAGGYTLAGFNSAWADTSSTLTSRNGVDRLWELNYLENFNNIAQANAGEVVGLQYRIEVQANNNEGPFELFATSDFSQSFKFGLDTTQSGSSVTEVNLLVPEPGTLVALGMAITGFLSRRKRPS